MPTVSGQHKAHQSARHIEVLLAVKAHVAYVEFKNILTNAKNFHVTIRKARSINDLKQQLKTVTFDLFILDATLISKKVSETLISLQQQHNLPPTVLVTHKDSQGLRKLGQQLNVLNTVVLNDVDTQALTDVTKLALDYTTIQKQNDSIFNDTNIFETLKNTFSFKAHLDNTGRPIIYWASKTFAEVTGYSLDDLKTLPTWLGNVVKEDVATVTLLENKINAMQTANGTLRCLAKDGTVLRFDVTVEPHINSQSELIGMIGSVKNITEQSMFAANKDIQQQREQAILSVSQALNQLTDSVSIFKACAQAIQQILQADVCHVFMQDNAEHEFVLRYNSETDKGHARSIIPIKESNEAFLLSLHKQSLLVDDPKSYPALTPSRFLSKQKKPSYIISPIMQDDLLLGFIAVYHRDKGYFKQYDVRFVEQICVTLASTINQAASNTIIRAQLPDAADDISVIDVAAQIEDTSTLSNFSETNIESAFQSGLDLRTRDAVMSVIARISEWFLQTSNWRSVIEQSMAALSQAILSPSAKLYEVNTDLIKSVQCDLIYNTQISPDQPVSNTLDLHARSFNKFQDILHDGKSLTITEDGPLTKSECKQLAKHGLDRHLIIPIFVNQLWWGFMAFAPPTKNYDWPKPIVHAFRIAANIVGPAISRSEHESALQALTEVSVGQAGQDYVDSLTKQIAHFTQADICFISENLNDETRIISFWSEDQSIQTIDFDPNIEPNNQARLGYIVHFADNAHLEFPDNPLLKQYKISSYSNLSVGINDNQTVGNLVILKSQPMQLTERQIQILEICSNRVGLELERMQRELDINRLARIPLESPYMVMILDLNGQISFFNPICRKVMKAVDCRGAHELLPSNHDEIVANLKSATGEKVYKPEIKIGHLIFEWVYIYEEDLGLIHLYGIDLTERRKLEDKLRQDAFSDSLTNLPNRAYFTSVVRKALDHMHRRSNYKFAVLFLDLDRFKVINDSLGHLFGDRLLQEVATRLKNTLRPGDTVARLGGDEFAILLDAIENEGEATMITQRIIASFDDMFIIDGNELFTSTSIGIAISHTGYHNIEEIIRDADIAMYSAKRNAKNNYAVFDANMHKEAVHIMHLENDLRNALLRNHLECYYQPIYSFAENAISGFEALVRWNHPTRGLLRPTEFIHLAEETGLIHDLDLWIFEDSCRQLSEWHKLYPSTKHLTVSINLSAFHFNRVELIAKIGNIFDKYQLDPASIKLEVTESVIMDSINAANEIFSVLKSRGMKISIDDFGVGYSSLGRLISLPVDTLKIDRSFIVSLTKEKNSRNVTRAIIDLAQVLSLDVIAEGVETREQANLLERLGCNYIQGFLVNKPVPAFDAEQLIKNRFRLTA